MKYILRGDSGQRPASKGKCNMAASNVAYNLSAYQPAPKQSRSAELKMVRNRNRVYTTTFTLRAFCSFAIVVTLFSLIIYNQVRLTEITADINQLTKQLDELQSENVVMASTLESIISLPAIAEQAKNELGMNRLDKYQTEYIILQQEDEIQRTEQSPSEPLSQKIQLQAKSLIISLKEYMTK